MADVNQRALFTNNWWDWNPNITAANRNDITQTYGTQVPQLNIPQGQSPLINSASQQNQGIGALATPVQPPTSNDSIPLTEAQASSPPPMSQSLKDRFPGVVNQGGPVKSANQTEPTVNISNNSTGISGLIEKGRNYATSILPPHKKAAITQEAVTNLQEQGISLTSENVNNEISRLTQGATESIDDSSVPMEEITTPYATPDRSGIESILPISEDNHPLNKKEVMPSDNVKKSSEVIDFLESNKDPEETLQEFAKRIGINLKDKPYDNWDYIRDMSAGLLASKEDTFFGALGDAALLSNQQRDKAETGEDSKRSQLAVAKWKSDEDWKQLEVKNKALIDAATIKAGGENPLKLGPSLRTVDDGNGNKIEYKIIEKGKKGLDPKRIVEIDGINTLAVTSVDKGVLQERKFTHMTAFNKEAEDWVDSDRLDHQISYVGENTAWNENMLAKWKSTDSYKKTIVKLNDSKEDGAEKLANALEDGNAQEAFQYASALTQIGGVGKSLADAYYTGLLSQLSPGERNQIKTTILSETRKRMEEKYDPANPKSYVAWDFIQPATSYVLKNMKWDETGTLKFDLGSTQSELNNFRSGLDAITGEDRNKEWWTWGWLNQQEFVDGDPRKELGWEAPFNRPDESSIFNKNQWELLPEDQKQDVENIGSNIISTLKKDFNVSEKQGINDILASITDSNSIGGGEDIWLWKNQQSKLRKPKQWYVEPIAYDKNNKRRSVDELRKKGIMWNGFKGEWFTFQKDQEGEWRRKIVTNNSSDAMRSISID